MLKNKNSLFITIPCRKTYNRRQAKKDSNTKALISLILRKFQSKGLPEGTKCSFANSVEEIYYRLVTQD